MSSLKFIILSYGRTGSNYLVHSLNMHKRVSCFMEIFNLNNDKRGVVFGHNYEKGQDAISYANKNIWGNSNLSSIRGFKVFYFHCNDRADFWDLIRNDSSIHVIHLTRENLFLRYLSEKRAEKINVWHPINEKYHDQNVLIKIDTKHLVDAICRLEEREKFFRLALERPIIEIKYEGLANGTDLKLVFDFLGIKDHPTFKPFTKSAVNSNKVHIENANEVIQALKSIGREEWYEEFLK